MRIANNNVIAFDSMVDLQRYMKPSMCHGSDEGGSWYGNLTAAQSLAMLTTGDQSRVAAAQQMMDKFDIRLDTAGQQLGYGVAGFMPCVPEYLGGSPDSMFCMEEVQSSSQPIKVLVDLTSSAGILQEAISRRGTTILAAVLALSATRAVQLEVVTTLDCADAYRKNRINFSATRCAINSAPLDLGSACYALCHAGFARHVMYGASIHNFKSPGRWASCPGVEMSQTRAPSTIAKILELLEEDPETTLWIPGIHLHDDILLQPEKWISSVLAKYGQPALA